MNTPRLTKPGPDDLGSGEKAANGLVSNLDAFFAADKKQASTSDADWTKAAIKLRNCARHARLGGSAAQDDDAAEKEFGKALQLNPNNAQVSYWLAPLFCRKRNQSARRKRLFHFARAASLDQRMVVFPLRRGSRSINILSKHTTSTRRRHGRASAARDLAKMLHHPPANFKIET